MDNTPEIEPCPYCAATGDDVRIERDPGLPHIACFKCKATGPDSKWIGSSGRIVEAISAWNTVARLTSDLSTAKAALATARAEGLEEVKKELSATRRYLEFQFGVPPLTAREMEILKRMEGGYITLRSIIDSNSTSTPNEEKL